MAVSTNLQEQGVRFARIPVVLASVALLLVLISGPGTRLELWHFRTGFMLMTGATIMALGALALGLLLLLVPRARRGHGKLLVVGMALGLAAAAMPLLGAYTARTVPFIHDVSTDTQRPPEFVAILPLRADAPNPAAYGGPQVAAAQLAGYPDIRSLVLEIAPPEAFARAGQLARDMGWEIVASVPREGRIEATDTTFWYGFKDDIVIRIEPEAAASRIDIRSVSRVGKSDVGKNAARIRAFLARLNPR